MDIKGLELLGKATMSPKLKLHVANMRRELDTGVDRTLREVRTVLMKEVRKNLSGRVLQKRSGHLYRTLEWFINIRKSGRRKTGGMLRIGHSLARAVYARIHIHGGMTGRNHATRIPKRDFLFRALVEKKQVIRSLLQAFVARVARGK